MHWTTGVKLFEVIQHIPEDPGDVDCWDELCDDSDSQAVVTLNDFTEKERISCEFDEDTKVCRNHKRHLVDVKKPKTLEVCKFASLLQCHHENLLPTPPGAPEQNASHNADEIKHVAFNTMSAT